LNVGGIERATGYPEPVAALPGTSSSFFGASARSMARSASVTAVAASLLLNTPATTFKWFHVSTDIKPHSGTYERCLGKLPPYRQEQP